jgi:hypothetical protein
MTDTDQLVATDIELLTAWQQVLEKEAASRAAIDAHTDAEWRAQHAFPSPPECVKQGWVKIVAPELDPGGRGWVAVDMRSEVNPRWEEHRQLTDEAQTWIDACEATKVQCGVGDRKKDSDDAWQRRRDAIDAFISTPARTLTGIAFKTTALLHFDYEARKAWRTDTSDGIDYELQICSRFERTSCSLPVCLGTSVSS